MRKNLQKILIAALTFFLVIYSPAAFAENNEEGIFIEAVSELNNGILTVDEIRTRTAKISDFSRKVSIEADGYYICDNSLKESSYVASDRARADAKRLLSEQATLHIKSISTVKKGKLTRDEIHTLSVVILQIKSETVTTEVLEDSTTQYHCHIKALLDTENFFDQLSFADKDKFNETVRRTIEIEKESARLNAELAALKKKYKNASKIEQEKIYAELKRNEQQFTAAMWSEQGFEFYGRNNFDEATKCFLKAVEVNPNYVAAWNGLGCTANYQRNFDKAIEYCYKAVEIDPTYSAAWNNLGYAYTYKGNLDKAIECYKRSIEIDPQDTVSQINLGNVYDSLKNYDEAIKCYQKALEIDPNYANACNSLGYVYIQRGEFDKGIEYCQKALAIDSHYAAAWNGLAYSYNQKKKFYKAIECCRKAVSLNKNYANAWNNLGYACSKVNRYEDSFTAYSRAVKISPNVKLYRDNFEIANKRINSFKSL